MPQNPPKPTRRTFRFYLDVEVQDNHPEDPELEWEALEEARQSFYNMIDDGVEPDVMEIF
jgi:hypothetical protein